MTTETTSKPWARRMAERLAGTDDVELIDATLEAAGEMKAVQLKVLLARCLEVISESVESDEPAHVESGFLGVIREVIA